HPVLRGGRGRRVDSPGVEQAAPARLRTGLPELHRPGAAGLAGRLLRPEPQAPRGDPHARRPPSLLQLPPGHRPLSARPHTRPPGAEVRWTWAARSRRVTTRGPENEAVAGQLPPRARPTRRGAGRASAGRRRTHLRPAGPAVEGVDLRRR